MDEHQQDILHALFDSPTYFVRGLEEESKLLVLQKMNRQTYQSTSFLNERILPADDLYHVLPLKPTLAHFHQIAPPPRPIHFIFHFALCGSTLLSRCLDHPGYTMVYKEPDFLHQISCYLRFPKMYDFPYHELLAFCLACLQRTDQPAEVPIVKLTDSCSNLVADCLDFHQEAKGIILYSKLDTFLLATLKSKKRRAYIRGMYLRAKQDFASAGITLDQSKESLSDAQMSGYVWSSLMHRYRNRLTYSHKQLRSLRMESLLTRPEEVLRGVSDFMDLKLSAPLITSSIKDGAFSKNSKAPDLVFDSATYKAQRAAIQSELSAEINEGRAWVDQICAIHPLDDALPSPLIGTS